MVSYLTLLAGFFQNWKERYIYQEQQQERGQFIVIEGVSGIGKTTLAYQLVNMFNRESERAIYMSFPQRISSSGRVISDHFEGNLPHLSPFELHFLFVNNRMGAVSKIKALLDTGKIVVCENFWMSGTAHSVARDLSNIDWCIKTEPEEVKELPDVTVLLDGIDVVLKAKRELKEDKEVTEKESFMKEVDRNYNELFARVKYPGTYIKIELRKYGDIHKEVFDLINKHMQ